MQEDKWDGIEETIEATQEDINETIADMKRSVDGYADLSEDSLTSEFVAVNGGNFRHVGQWMKWLLWEDGRWRIDHNFSHFNQVRAFMRLTARELSARLARRLLGELAKSKKTEANKEDAKRLIIRRAQRQTRSLRSTRAISNIVTMARADERIALNVEQLDSDPWLLNTPDGTVDLRTGDVLKHNLFDYITKQTAAGPGMGQPKMWLESLNTIMRGDAAMVAYLQKVFGYCLVGETKEHEMYFGYGTGANGKGVTLNTIRDLLGDYGVEAAIETFISNPSIRHPTELADLRGARLVTCGETDEGQRWAEARIKMLTGGDPVKARFMRQDFFQFTPQFKLFLAGNHKPKLRNVDEAIERRFRLIPFTHTIPKELRDTNLAKKLRAEWPQILHWCIEGCLLWQREGLKPPETVAAATKSYLSQEDSLTSWFEEAYELDGKGWIYIADLFESWRQWAIDNGEEVGTKRKLMLTLEDRESVWRISQGRREKGIGFRGLRAKHAANGKMPNVQSGEADGEADDSATISASRNGLHSKKLRQRWSAV
jgi:putative DNA primase/helicase